MGERTVSPLSRARKALERNGPLYLIRKASKKLATNPIIAAYYRAFKQASFDFQGKEYDYFYHHFNETWKKARAVEIPIAKRCLEDADGEVLEIGNVLPYYFSTSHDVLDKYEKAEGVINQDIVDFEPGKKYDLVISISTLEHIGYDYGEESDPKKIMEAVERIQEFLSENGKLVATMPLGYNPSLDELLENDELGFEKHYLKRVTRYNRWEEVEREEAETAEYGSPYPAANAIVIATLEN